MNKQQDKTTTGLEIAVIGMAGRFPGARDIHQFWENLENGTESISLSTTGIDPQLLDHPDFVKTRGGVLEDKDYFDAAFFGYTPNEAEIMDPQYRIFHQCAWEALEHAGYDPGTYNGLIGIYAGCTDNFQWQARVMLAGKQEAVGVFAADSLLHRDYLCTRAAYKLDLKGPAVVVQSACSTSLTAIHIACRSLLTSDCDMALAGGVKILPQENRGYLYQEGMIASPDGHCRAFDAKAAGTAVGDGIGLVVLKRLKYALADNDCIHAVIKSSAINNDGLEKVGFTAPSIEGESAAISKALRIGKIEPESISYIECHGTATPLGDPIEINALIKAFNTDKKKYCPIGSVKTNVGHLDAAAGVTGFIKTVLALKHKLIPPSLHFENPNPAIDFENSPFYVNTKLIPWKNDKYPLRAGVSSFGIGGTNAHVILEEWRRDRTPDQEPPTPQIIVLSAKTPSALDKITANLALHLRQNPDIDLNHAAYTLQVGRKPFPHRGTTVCSTVEEAGRVLAGPQPGAITTALTQNRKQMVFMFPGQGAQYVNMGRELYRTRPIFREEADRCFEILKGLAGIDIKEILYPAAGPGMAPLSPGSINDTGVAQPLIFIFQYALARMLMEWGLKPFAMIGHSIGEYTAACISGVFSPADALSIVALRGKLMRRMPAGAMLGVNLPETQLMELVNNRLELAAVNGPDQCVLSGSLDAIRDVETQLQKKGLQTRKLHTSHAFHSRFMDPILNEFQEAVARTRLNEPGVPYISNLTGNWISVEEALDPAYWARHLRQTVRFYPGLARILNKEEEAILVDIGPGRTLATLARRHPDKKTGHEIIDITRHPDEHVPDNRFLCEKIGQIWLYGGNINWDKFHGPGKPRRIPLPTYPFETQRFHIDDNIPRDRAINLADRQEPAGLPRGSRFYIPSWKHTVTAAAPTGGSEENWLVFTNDEKKDNIALRALEKITHPQHPLIRVQPGTGFKKTGPGTYTVNPAEPGDYDALIKELQVLDRVPDKILHAWNAGPAGNNRGLTGSPVEISTGCLDRGFYSLLYLARAAWNRGLDHPMEWTILSGNMMEVPGDDVSIPQKATLLGPVMVIPLEYPHINCRSVDVKVPEPRSRQEEILVRQLAAELSQPVREEETRVVFRGNYRLIQTFEPVVLEGDRGPAARLRQGGVYLITGGLGGIGGVIARFLAKQVNARLILTGRTGIPPANQRRQWLASQPVHHPLSRKIRLIRELEEIGAQIAVYNADVADENRMRRILAEAEAQFGPINGIIHCAGIAGGGIIQQKNRQQANAVLAPKVRGTLVLDRITAGKTLDFFVLCSSINSVLPRSGQVDYCAANAFLDAFAAEKTSRDSTFTVSIAWDTWLEVGMAVEAAEQQRGSIELTHPLLNRYIPGDQLQAAYITYFRLENQWVLNEHMISPGKGLTPGVCYLEMAAASFSHFSTNSTTRILPLELRDIHFQELLTVETGETREVTVELEKKPGENTTRFIIKSRTANGKESWQNHALGKVTPLPAGDGNQPPQPPRHDLRDLQNRCPKEILTPVPRPGTETPARGNPGKIHTPLITGPRWNNMKRLSLGENRGLATLEIDPAYTGDFESYYLHPALLDIAAAFLYPHTGVRGPYIPFSYKRVRVYKPLPAKVRCYSRLLRDEETRQEFLRFDITVMDETGTVCVDIEEFTMLEVSAEILQRINRKGSSPAAAPPPALARPLLKDGILPARGIDAFNRILAGNSTRVVVSTRELNAEIRRGRQKPPTAKTTAYSRPPLSSTFIPPQNPTQQKLANTWKEVLGINHIGVLDNFFELGGDSLKALAVTGKIHKESHTNITLAEFFARPTIKDLAQYIASHTRHDTFYSIKNAEEKEYYPLSSAQKRLYILQRMEPDSVGYNLTNTVLLKGEPDMAGFESVFRHLIRRHESLRTSFRMVGREPVQEIHDGVEFKIEHYNSAAKTAKNREEKKGKGEEIHHLAGQFIRPFDLSRAPLLRVGLVKLPAGDNGGSSNGGSSNGSSSSSREGSTYLMVLDVHHIIHDGTSQVIFYKELSALLSGGMPPVLRTRYRDYAEWQNLHKKEEAIKKQEEYWLGEFKGEIPLLNLPLDYPRPAVQSLEGNTIKFSLSAGETNALRTAAAAGETTLFMVVLALYNLLLARLANQEDIVVATPTAGRKHPDLQPVIGTFLNTLALRNYPSPAKSFREFLQEVKQRTLTAFDNQDYPFEDLVDKLEVNIKRDLGRNPLFDAIFILHNEVDPRKIPAPETKTRKPAFTVSPYDFVKQTAEVDLSLIGYENENHLNFRMEYCAKLFKQETVRRFINCFKQILSSVSANPAREIHEVEMIPAEEKKQVLYGFNNTAAPFPRDNTIHGLFAQQVQKNPDGTAILGRCQTLPGKGAAPHVHLTYRELDRQSLQWACFLQEKGVRPETIVAIKTDRTLEMIIGILAILKSAAAYLPIDPDYPRERIDYMLADSGANILLDDQVFSSRQDISPGPGPAPAAGGPGPAASLAYVIYTSGSTGKPKGVMIEHKAVLNFITGMTDAIDFQHHDIFLSLTTLSFDIFGLETVLPLTRGYRTVMGTREEQLDAAAAAQVIRKENITALQVTPSRLRLLLANPDFARQLRHLGYLLVGGELFPETLLEKAKQIIRGKIYNLYGPTETTIWSAVKDVSTGQSLNIGKPIANTRIYILNYISPRHASPRPIGVPGELVIAGEGLSRGYCNNQHSTARKFYPNPAVPGEIIYRTGDLARWLADGNIEFLGRIDTQVKIRGFRIELEEIETLLLQHEAVKEAVAVVKENRDKNPFLCAYIVPVKEVTPDELREFLARKVPPYMLPSYFITLERMPLTPNRKLDRKALPQPEATALAAGREYISPRDEWEKRLAAIWQEVLGVEKVSVTDDFFKLGGNSMLMLTLISQIKKEYSLELSMLSIFRAPTLEGVAGLIRTGKQGGRLLPEPVVPSHHEQEVKKEMNRIDEFVSLESGSILTAVTTGMIPPVDAAVLNYLPMDILQHTPLSREDIVEGILHNLPWIWQITQTGIGRLAHIMLPVFSYEIFRGSADICRTGLEAIRIAVTIGARVVGLTGHMQKPQFIREMETRMKNMKPKPALTTGMDTNVACMLLSYRGLLETARRDISRETIALVGPDQMSLVFLKLALKYYPHPREIIISHISNDNLPPYHEEELKKQYRRLRKVLSYHGPLQITHPGGMAPAEAYRAGMIIGAVENTIEIEKIQPGTMLINLCAPLVAFNRDKAWERIREKQDILVQNGVVRMTGPHPAQTLFYAMNEWKEFYGLIHKVVHQLNVPDHTDPYAPINSCQFSPLLTAVNKKCPPTTGQTDPKNSEKHFAALEKLEFSNSRRLLCGEKIIEPQWIEAFRRGFGESASGGPAGGQTFEKV